MPFLSTIEPSREIDVYRVHLVPGVNYTAVVHGESHGLRLADPSVTIRNPTDNAVIASGDNSPDGNKDPVVPFTVPLEADYDLVVSDRSGDIGSYQAGVLDPQGQIVNGTFVGSFLPTTQIGTLDPLPTPATFRPAPTVNTEPFTTPPTLTVAGVPPPDPELAL